MTDNDHQISNYDRSYGSLHNSQFLYTKPSTVKDVDFLGRSETFIIETVRVDRKDGNDDVKGDVIFIECINMEGHTRLRLPPAAANAIVRQRDSLTTRSRRIASKATMKQRMADGFVPVPPKRKKRK